MKTQDDLLKEILQSVHGVDYVVETNDFFEGVFYSLKKLKEIGLISFEGDGDLASIRRRTIREADEKYYNKKNDNSKK